MGERWSSRRGARWCGRSRGAATVGPQAPSGPLTVEHPEDVVVGDDEQPAGRVAPGRAGGRGGRQWEGPRPREAARERWRVRVEGLSGRVQGCSWLLRSQRAQVQKCSRPRVRAEPRGGGAPRRPEGNADLRSSKRSSRPEASAPSGTAPLQSGSPSPRAGEVETRKAGSGRPRARAPGSSCPRLEVGSGLLGRGVDGELSQEAQLRPVGETVGRWGDSPSNRTHVVTLLELD